MQGKGTLRSRVLPCLTIALLTAATPGTGVAMESQRSLSVIALQCPQDVKQPDALCQSMLDTLARRSPASVVRTVQDGEELELRPGDLRVALHVDDMTDTTMTAHLEWQVGETDAVRTGPQIEFTVMDTTLRPALFDQFADGLVTANPDFLETLP